MGIDMSGTELTWRLYVIRDRVGFYAEIQIFLGQCGPEWWIFCLGGICVVAGKGRGS